MIFNTYKQILEFDEVTKFRLINAFLVAIGTNLIFPLMIGLKGELLLPWIISLFLILDTIAVKTNAWFTSRFSISSIYKMTAVVHLAFALFPLLYFISPLLMVYVGSVLTIIEITIFSAYSIMLNTYLAKNFPDSMHNFQIVRNSTWADGILIGLSVVTLITFFYSVPYTIIVFVVYNFFFSLWLIRNWRFFDKI